ncbi:excinuclease ABC subunit UvrC [Geotalea sp. SG265]|uniref:excinuclease ABC subunit UvrC n=1 Tax=Geotalea sp. SG265 TaxID=2922867 RepID=UPI001FB020B2|nr:excinuclease ABC subunit UvrC [Geotalea sp. SG265]
MIGTDRISHFPSSPGVYIMKDADGTVLYVGKARDLRKRIRSYFAASGDSRYHIRFLMARVTDIEFIVTDTEKEALILENTLIKQYRPKYNFNLRDDKTYFSLRMDMSSEFPRLTIIRRVTRDGARYFGPYSSASDARAVLKHLYKLFPLRHYPMETCRRRNRPCLFFQLRQCSAPCHGKISRDDYLALAEGAALFLEGKNREIVRIFRERMNAAAAAENYEEAARFRDLIRSIEVTVEKQKMVAQGGDADVIGLFRDMVQLHIAILFIRGGTLTGNRNYSFAWEMDDSEGVASFLNEYYNRDVFIPAEILLPSAIDDPLPLEELLSELRGKRVSITFPRRGKKLELVQLASKNAETAAAERKQAADSGEAILQILKERLHLQRLPRRIECYDISNIQGRMAVGSKVSFLDGKADKGNYRRYRIKGVGQADDFAMMREMLARRFKPGTAAEDRPDLIVVDGGIGQLNVLTRVLDELQISDVAAAGLAKSRVDREMEASEISRSDERVFLPNRKNPVVLRQNSAPLLLLARIRDEAHRFAITYHKKLRGKDLLASQLESIAGIGNKRKKALLRHFGSLKGITEATRDELCKVPGISASVADSLWQHLHQNEKGDA